MLVLGSSRVVEVAAGERNYHIFYQMLTDEAIRKLHGLPLPAELSYLSNEGKVATIEEMNDTKEFAAVVHALGVFKFSPDEIAAVWRMLAAVLLLGNVTFRPKAKEVPDVDRTPPQHCSASARRGSDATAALLRCSASAGAASCLLLLTRCLPPMIVWQAGSVADIASGKDWLDAIGAFLLYRVRYAANEVSTLRSTSAQDRLHCCRV